MNIYIKMMNIQGNYERIFRAVKAGVCIGQTKSGNCEQNIDRKTEEQYNIEVKLCCHVREDVFP